MKHLRIITILIIICLLTLVGVGCNNTPSNEDKQGNEQEETFEEHYLTFESYIVVRDEYCRRDTDCVITYDGKEVYTIGSEDDYRMSFEYQGEFDVNKFGILGKSNFIITYKKDTMTSAIDVPNTAHFMTFIYAETANFETDFVDIGGTVVQHYDGETRLDGCDVYINGMKVFTLGTNGTNGADFNFNYVLKGCQLSMKKDGYYFVDVAGNNEPYQIVSADRPVYRFRVMPEIGED